MGLFAQQRPSKALSKMSSQAKEKAGIRPPSTNVTGMRDRLVIINVENSEAFYVPVVFLCWMRRKRVCLFLSFASGLGLLSSHSPRRAAACSLGSNIISAYLVL